MHVARRSLSLLLVAGLALGGLAGCKTRGGAKGEGTGKAAQTAAQPGEAAKSAFPMVHEDWAKLGYRLDWVSFPFGGVGRPIVRQLQAGSDLVIVQAQDSTVAAMETATGRRRWATDLTGPNTKWVGVDRIGGDQGQVLVASESELFGLAAGTGALQSRERFEYVINTRPVLVSNLLVAGTSVGRVQAHAIGRKLTAWAFMSNGAFESAPVLIGDTIAIVSQAGDVLFMNPTGNLMGRSRVFGAIDADPATDGSSLFVASRDQSLWAFAPSGAVLWRHRTSNPLNHSPAFFNGMVYCDLGGEGFTAFDPVTGKPRWTTNKVHGNVIGTRNGRLLVRDEAGVSLVDTARGDVLARAELPGVGKIVGDKFEDGTLYAVSTNGVLAKFILR